MLQMRNRGRRTDAQKRLPKRGSASTDLSRRNSSSNIATISYVAEMTQELAHSCGRLGVPRLAYSLRAAHLEAASFLDDLKRSFAR